MTVEAYIKENPSSKAIIEAVNTLLAPLEIEINEVIKGAQSIKYKLNLPLNLGIQEKIMRKEKTIKYAISSALGSTDFIYNKDARSIYFEVKSNEFKTVDFNEFRGICKTRKLNLVLGKDENGEKIYTNLSKAPHILVGGTTGSGKSELLHTFVASLVLGMPYTNVELKIIDPKRAEYSAYKNRKRITLITEVSEAFSCLNDAVDLMEKRYTEFERVNVKDISSYHGSMDMHPIVIIIDELADLIQSRKEIEKPIVRIAQKARACGIHLILGTQSPRKTVVTGLIQTNTPTKIALHTADSLESRIIIGKSGAEKLLGKGDMLFHGNGAMDDIRIQSAYVSNEQKNLIASTLPYEEKKASEKVDFNPIDFTRPFKITPDGYGHIYYDEPNTEYRSDGTIIHHQPTSRPQNNTKTTHKHAGFIKTFTNLMNVKPVMFRTSEYPPRI